MTYRALVRHLSFFALLLPSILPAVCWGAPCPPPSVSIDESAAVNPCSSPHFPQPTEFEGTFDPNDITVLGGQSKYVGHIVFASMSRSLVAGVLPLDLRLAAASTTAM